VVRILLAIDDVKQLAWEEMKAVFDDGGRLTRITKSWNRPTAHGDTSAPR
jgi:hypothetical protein